MINILVGLLVCAAIVGVILIIQKICENTTCAVIVLVSGVLFFSYMIGGIIMDIVLRTTN